MIRWRDLITTSRLLTRQQAPAAAPVEDSLRRAVSTAYYAMFHALATSNADCLVGTAHDPISRHAWTRVYRGLGHREAKRNLQQEQDLFSQPVRNFTNTFVELQDQRHLADYDPDQAFPLSAVLNWIDRAEEAISDFMLVSQDERSAVAIQVLIRRRSG